MTEISIGVRKIIKYAAIAFGIYLALRFALFLGVAYWKATHIPPPPPPDVAFDMLPKIKFPENMTNTADLTFTLQNVEGKPPETTASARVFEMPKKSYTFESGENAKELAIKLGFEGEPKVDTVYYYFTRLDNPLLTLFVDGVNLNYRYKYDYSQNPDILKEGKILTIEDAEKNSRDFLNFTNLWDTSIFDGTIKSEVLTYDGRLEKMVEATSLSTAQAVRVNYFRKDIDNLPLVTDEYFRSHNFVLYSETGTADVGNMLEISYIFWPIDEEKFGSYPLISGEQAYDALTKGEGYVVSKGYNENNITIRKIYLAYYDSALPQTYLQPVFVFEGDNNFVAYYPAVSPEYLK